MRRMKADLHIHTALSPCADEAMTPPAIIREALNKALDMLAICDHNAAGNCRAVQKAGSGLISVIPGIEITTREDVHVLGYFPEADQALEVAEKVRSTLPEKNGNCDKFGKQLLHDYKGNIIATEPKMLNASSSLNLSEAILLIKKYHGLAVAAHINRPSFGVLSQLGIFPVDAGFDAIEYFISPRSPPNEEKKSYGLQLLCSSDSHFISDIGTRFTMIEMQKPTFKELFKAIQGLRGRRCVIA